MDWIDLVEDRDQWRTLVKKVTNHGVAKIAGMFMSSYTIGDFSRRVQLREVNQLLSS
jgi:hypothetical protein